VQQALRRTSTGGGSPADPFDPTLGGLVKGDR